MQVHIFRGPGRVFAFTTDPSRANLPSGYASWAAFRVVELQKDVPTPGVDVNDCLRDLEAFGVHVTDAHVRITEDAVRGRCRLLVDARELKQAGHEPPVRA